jgi:protein SCO1/2
MTRILFLLSMLFTCTSVAEEAQHHHVHGSELPAVNFSSESLFLTESEWSTHLNKTIQLRDLRGRPRVLALFYASCTSACPILVDQMKQIERALGAAADRVGFVLVTFDPRDDTREVLEAYADKRSLEPSRWLLLRGDEDDTQELAVLVGSKYKRLGPKNFAHSNLLVYLDEEGRIQARSKSFRESDDFTARVLELTSASSASRSFLGESAQR